MLPIPRFLYNLVLISYKLSHISTKTFFYQFNIPIISSNSEYKNVALNVVYFKDKSKNRHRMLFIYIYILHFQ